MQTTQAPPSILRQETSFELEGLRYKAVLLPSCLDPLFVDVECDSVFQTRDYHAALEAAPPGEMEFWYVRLERDEEVIGMLSFQIKDFNPGDSLKKHAEKNFIQKTRYRFASLIKLKVLCLGNTTVTGDYGFCFSKIIELRLQTLLMMRAIDWLLTLPEFRKIKMIFIKDFDTDIFKDIPGTPYCSWYHAIDTQPSMIMDVPSSWRKLDDYLSALKSKYRIRANKALEKSANLERIELNADEIEAIEPQLHALYRKVVGDVGFNLFILSPHYFSTIKRSLGNKFKLWIYRDKGELISFFTIVEDGDILDAHFLGYDPKVNEEFKLYMTMLIRIIELATEKGFRRLQFSRTATEIKSSVGAAGITMWAYLRLRNRVFNTLLPRVYSFFKPDLSWEPRHPFR
jgi:hypothetical protein